MRVHVKINQQGVNINETVTAASADEVVGKMKARVARELPFAMRLAVNAMGNLMFAQEVVKRYGDSQKRSLPVPRSCEEFLTMAQAEGFATIEEE